MRTDERSAVFDFGQSRSSHSDVSPCAKHPLPLRQQAMTMHLSRRDEHHVMKAITGKPGIAMGKELTRPNGDCGVDKVNSIAEGGEKAVEPVPESVDARQLARRNSSDGHFDLDE
jgi:hypothetical protein